MRLHLENAANLGDVDVLAIPEADDLIKGTEELKAVAEHGGLIERSAEVGDGAGEEVEGVNVLENVGVLVGDEDHVEVLERLVDEADGIGLDRGVLGASTDQLGEGGKKSLNARPRHVAELSRDDGCVRQRSKRGQPAVGWEPSEV